MICSVRDGFEFDKARFGSEDVMVYLEADLIGKKVEGGA